MRPFFIHILTLFLLTACGAATPAVPSGSRTTVPEFTPGNVVHDIEFMFGLNEKTIKEIESACDESRFLCVNRAMGKQGFVGANAMVGVDIDPTKHVILGMIPEQKITNVDGKIVVKGALPANGMQENIDYLIKSNSESSKALEFASWLQVSTLEESANEVEFTLSLFADNNFSFSATRGDGNNFAMAGLMTPITVEELMGVELEENRELTFSGVTSDGGMMFDVEKSVADVKFDENQSLIAGMGEKYTLTPDGYIYDDENKQIHGLRYDQASGKWFLGNGSAVVEINGQSLDIKDTGEINVVTVGGTRMQKSNGVWSFAEEMSSGAVVTVTADGGIDIVDRHVLEGLIPDSAYDEVSKYLDTSFVLLNGGITVDGKREILTTNKLGEKVVVATVDANGMTVADDILKYKLTMDMNDESCQMPLELVQNAVLPGQIIALKEQPVLPTMTVREGRIVRAGDNNNVWDAESAAYYAEHPNEVPYRLAGMCYGMGPTGKVYPVRVYEWMSGGRSIYLTYIYRSSDRQSTLPSEAWQPADRYQGSTLTGNEPNPLKEQAADPNVNAGVKEWVESGVIPEWLAEYLLLGTTHNR